MRHAARAAAAVEAAEAKSLQTMSDERRRWLRRKQGAPRVQRARRKAASLHQQNMLPCCGHARTGEAREGRGLGRGPESPYLIFYCPIPGSWRWMGGGPERAAVDCAASLRIGKKKVYDVSAVCTGKHMIFEISISCVFQRRQDICDS